MAVNLADYRAALRTPGVAAPAAASAVGRFPMAMIGLAALFYVQRTYGTFAWAGFTAAAALAGEGLGTVLQGRLIDRLGPSRPLVVAATLSLLYGGALIWAVEHRAGLLTLLVASLLLGISVPALPGASRALWTRLVPAGPRREAALTYEVVSLEVFFILGPAAAAVLLAAPWAGTGFAVALGALFAGTVAFAVTRTVRPHRPARAEVADRSPWGALATRGMRVVPLTALGFGCVVGAVELGVPAATTRAGHPALAGAMLSAWSVVSVLFGVLYQRRPWPVELHHRAPVLVGAFGLAVAAMAGFGLLPGVTGLLLLGAAMLVAGTLITPQVTTQSLLVERCAPAGTGTEAFGWTITAATAGLALGQAVGGALAQAYGPSAALLAGALGGLACAAALAALADRLRDPAATPGPVPGAGHPPGPEPLPDGDPVQDSERR